MNSCFRSVVNVLLMLLEKISLTLKSPLAFFGTQSLPDFELCRRLIILSLSQCRPEVISMVRAFSYHRESRFIGKLRYVLHFFPFSLSCIHCRLTRIRENSCQEIIAKHLRPPIEYTRIYSSVYFNVPYDILKDNNTYELRTNIVQLLKSVKKVSSCRVQLHGLYYSICIISLYFALLASAPFSTAFHRVRVCLCLCVRVYRTCTLYSVILSTQRRIYLVMQLEDTS